MLFFVYLLVLFGVWTYLPGGFLIAGGGVGPILLIGLGVFFAGEYPGPAAQTALSTLRG